jgi:hypothetical protein
MSEKTVGQKILQLQGLLGTDAVTPWVTTFVEDMFAKSNGGKKTSHLTGRQVEKIDQIWREHFA